MKGIEQEEHMTNTKDVLSVYRVGKEQKIEDSSQRRLLNWFWLGREEPPKRRKLILEILRMKMD